jgi:protein-tyrosine phosphatase
LGAISQQVAALIEAGEIVYVHCRAGIQRAPLVACAVLLQMGWKLPDAFRLVSSRRSVAAMTDAQMAVLRELNTTKSSLAGMSRA